MLPLELTLVLAATRDMGIGRNGTLPWTGLRKEMAYFARVTKRLPPHTQPPALNAVIMGRKTWDSIPPRFRPLKGRLNIVISRAFAGQPPTTPADADEEPVRASSLEQAVAYLRARPEGEIGRVFIIGGAQIYDAALRLEGPEAVVRRVLLTRVTSDFECDAFFSLKLGEEGDDRKEEASLDARNWRHSGKAELDAWTGETVPEGMQEEAGTKYEFQMWERADDGVNT